ncbi:hypothetical protein RF11_12044 [Thelohanellus kitauei]|uniref:Uncharacterized protein n=1 Tax=Thelohanellus kitauei TaxID=669202 RepID=A0A0C2ITK8_THEKT|nr:hypothetical protein RF11_12044 [Thelohanellus kitauei]
MSYVSEISGIISGVEPAVTKLSAETRLCLWIESGSVFGILHNQQDSLIDRTNLKSSMQTFRKHDCRESAVDVSHDLESHLSKKSTTGISQITSFILGVDKDIKITEEFVETLCGLEARCESGHRWSALNDRQEGCGVKNFERKVTNTECEARYLQYECIVCNEMLCSHIMKVGNVRNVVVKTVNLGKVKGLNHRQFNNLLEEAGGSYGLPYHIELKLWEKELSESNPFHFSTRKSFLSDTGLVMMVTQNYGHKISALRYEFMREFTDFSLIKISFRIVRTPFSINTQAAPDEFKWN